jgi:hypothetical protein
MNVLKEMTLNDNSSLQNMIDNSKEGDFTYRIL